MVRSNTPTRRRGLITSVNRLAGRAIHRIPRVRNKTRNMLRGELVQNTSFNTSEYSAAKIYAKNIRAKRLGRSNITEPEYFARAKSAGLGVAISAQRIFHDPAFQKRLSWLPEADRKDIELFYRSLIKTGAAMRAIERRQSTRHAQTPDVLNKVTFIERMEKTLKADVGKPFSVAMMDLDFFKRVNTEFGHKVGDAVLDFFASELKRFTIRYGGFASRVGGEEYMVYLPHDPKMTDKLLNVLRLRIWALTQTPQVVIERKAVPKDNFDKWVPVSFTSGFTGFEKLRSHVNYEKVSHAVTVGLGKGKDQGRKRNVFVTVE